MDGAASQARLSMVGVPLAGTLLALPTSALCFWGGGFVHCIHLTFQPIRRMYGMDAALSDVVVIDLSRVFAGPYCTMMLGDMGATVIKVEQPGKGDDTRQFGPPYVAGESAYYLGLNRNKHSITLDFNNPDQKQRLLELISTATVLVENFRPGTLDRQGLGYETLRALNPGLIYCSISGYGQSGPYALRPGYDFVAQAESGIMSVTGEIDGDPQRVGSPVGDVSAGMYASIAILAALRVRDHTGKGQYI